LSRATNATGIATEWDNLLVLGDVLEVLDGAVDLPAVDRLSLEGRNQSVLVAWYIVFAMETNRFPSILERDAEVRAPRAGALVLIDGVGTVSHHCGDADVVLSGVWSWGWGWTVGRWRSSLSKSFLVDGIWGEWLGKPGAGRMLFPSRSLGAWQEEKVLDQSSTHLHHHHHCLCESGSTICCATLLDPAIFYKPNNRWLSNLGDEELLVEAVAELVVDSAAVEDEAALEVRAFLYLLDMFRITTHSLRG
jgi:hypothetical protein